MNIGIFDSGVGGLTVASALRRRLPAETLTYLGDTARLPYGTKSPETVVRYALQAADYLAAGGIKMLVVACNTASAHALPALVARHPGLPVLGVVEAGAAAAARASASGRIVVAATEGTCRSGRFPATITALRPTAEVSQVACPLLVAVAEEGLGDSPIAEAMARSYLADRFAGHGAADCLVLGCTHFPLLVPAIRRVIGPRPVLVDCAEAVAEQAAALLAERGLARQGGAGGLALIATDSPERFRRMAARLFPGLGSNLAVTLADL
ncbi:glutamate racemase [Magnetospirillum sp. UT-4]|uniref:glutamate racemase n=1 Tax=Magnetospirillum sp. UT-4 TaxID=2681467 RepID=UPI00137C95CA|nr:glutamate racemase [Magnetospirillum sp. UT-4]CAA7612714.1 Glutamate racemase [Magnetospirillum sp. UT-4]